VLYWVVKGKINRDIGDILAARPATVKKTEQQPPEWR
jgi:DNA-binding CsgD family transcriptional regulator